MRRKKRRNPRRERGWVIIHDAISNIFERMRYFKTTKDFLRLGYYGPLQKLRVEAIRILNAIDEMDSEGNSADVPYKKDRWE